MPEGRNHGPWKAGDKVERIRDPSMDDKIRTLLKITSQHPSGCDGRDGKSGFINRIRTIAVWRIENPILWEMYSNRKSMITRLHQVSMVSCTAMTRADLGDNCERLDATVNEVMLWHGTKAEHVPRIEKTGFDERLSSMHGMYGAGIYFSPEACKSAQYAPGNQTMGQRKHYIFYCRVILGQPYRTSVAQAQRRRPPTMDGIQGLTHDSILVGHSGGQVHREVVIFDRSQAYPEYLVEIEPW
eukprot:gnl/TRDRNA2_/TRDRNA2_177390_c0_seq11.p1 gnl/TRDRNA2_/TRDRNA2_177390_c0~~gnl/TRDRNA2_/TRDRNA2_177390_c0_seq11.p1  ORF type:complete len:250 (-),score=11.22 gnl/TRDRNA2_/TRDRNA2_177390_c0_seq11:19-744(-)